MKKVSSLQRKVLIFLAPLVMQSPAVIYADTAIYVPIGAKNTIDSAKNDYQATEFEQQNQEYKEYLEQQVAKTQTDLTDIQKQYEEVKSQHEQLVSSFAQLEQEKNLYEKDLLDLQAKHEQNQLALEQTYHALNAAAGKTAAVRNDLNEREAQMQARLEQSREQGGKQPANLDAYAVDWSELRQAESNYDNLRRKASQLEAQQKEYQAVLQEKLTSFEAINHEYYTNAEKIKLLQEQEENHLKYHAYLKEEQEKALQAREDYYRGIENPLLHTAFPLGIKYYSWKDKQGDSGRQILIPFGVWAGKKDFSVGLYTAYAFGRDHTAGMSGSVSALTDTYLDLNKRQKINSKVELEYLLGINIPTGKSALNFSQRNARMSDDLVEMDAYGTGWQYHPGIRVHWKPYKYDKWTFGTSVKFHRYYDHTSDIVNDDTKPGTEWHKFIKYQHAEKDWQFVAEIQNISYERSRFKNGFYYDTKDAWKYRLTYNRRIAKNQELMVYYWPEVQSRNNSGTYSLSNASRVDFYGLMWSRYLNERDRIRASFDIMQTNGTRYGGMRSFYNQWGFPESHYTEVDGRDKYTLGLGYDHHFGNKATLSVDLRYFWMHDGKTSLGEPATSYKGLNVFLMYSRNLSF